MDILKEENDKMDLNERELIRTEISTMSFEDLQKLKEKIGAKEYNQVVFGVEKNIIKKNVSITSFKRANKNRPRERSSKLRLHQKAEDVKQFVARDPRFDPLCGTYDERTFKNNYKFIKDVREKEREQLQKEYNNVKDPEKKQQLKLLIQRIDNQNREYAKRDKQQNTQQEERRGIRSALKKGQKPTFKKKSEKRIENLITKYEDLKSSNKLQKHLEKRYKKLAGKEKKNS